MIDSVVRKVAGLDVVAGELELLSGESARGLLAGESRGLVRSFPIAWTFSLVTLRIRAGADDVAVAAAEADDSGATRNWVRVGAGVVALAAADDFAADSFDSLKGVVTRRNFWRKAA